MALKLADPVQQIYRSRFDAQTQRRNEVWKALSKHFFQKYIPSASSVVDFGAGYCEFINNVVADKKVALDLNPDIFGNAASDVEAHQVDVSEAWPVVAGSADVCFSSNFIEHLPDKQALLRSLAEANKALKPGGLILLLGPNIRFCYDEYWDFFDHHLALSDRSVEEALQLSGFKVISNVPRFLPYTMKSAMPTHPLLIRIYLALPLAWGFLGKQFFVVGEKLR